MLTRKLLIAFLAFATVSATQADAVLGRIGTQHIHPSQVTRAGGDDLQEAKQALRTAQIEAARKAAIETVLTKEARSRHRSIEQLLNEEVVTKVRPVTAEEIDSFVEKNPRGFPQSNPEITRNIAKQILSQIRHKEAYNRFVDELFDKYDVSFEIQDEVYPEELRRNLSGPTDISKGPTKAPINMVVFSDFDSEFSKEFYELYKKLDTEFPNSIRIIYRFLPISPNELSHPMAHAALCAADQGKFWEYHDLLFDQLPIFERNDLRTNAIKLDLNINTFERCMTDQVHDQRIADDIAAARQNNARGAPTVFINGIRILGVATLPQFRSVISSELKHSSGNPGFGGAT